MTNERWYAVAETLVSSFTELQASKTIDSLENAARATLALLDELDLGFLGLVKGDIRGNISKVCSARGPQEKRGRRRREKGRPPQSRSGSMVHSGPSPALSSPDPRPARAAGPPGLASPPGAGGVASDLGRSPAGGLGRAEAANSVGSVDSVDSALSVPSAGCGAGGPESSLSPQGDEPLLITDSVGKSREVALGCIWLAHTFSFISTLMQNITDPALQDKSPSELAKMAYTATLRPHHNRATALMFELALKTLQNRKKFVERLGIDERDERLRAQIRAYRAQAGAFVSEIYQYYEAHAIKA